MARVKTAPFDPRAVDIDGFLAEIKTLRDEVDASISVEDFEHLKKFERIGRAATLLGLATAWVPNPLSMCALSLGRSTRWIVMHHVGHKGYDKVPGIPKRYTAKMFGRGKRRFLDWTDWMIPEAWNYEHNILHHGNTGETRDPDLVERNTEWLRSSGWPMPVRHAIIAALAVSWRFSYYAPNTFFEWRSRNDGTEAGEAKANHDRHDVRDLILKCYLPYGGLHFVAMPLMYLPLGPLAAWSALVNSIGAEALTNLHTFLVVGPNHTGEDLFRFEDRPFSKADGILRQVLGSVNYATGGDLTDYAHLWLNYQIEHHIFPDIPMLKYRMVQPKVKALCAKYGIPYIQESVWTRAKKMVDVAVGTATMKRAKGFAAKKRAVSTARRVVPDATEIQA